MLIRYLYCALDTDELHCKPTDQELENIVGRGVLGEVLARIRNQLEDQPTDDERLVLDTAMVALYRLAKELPQ